jgi:glutathione synthase/RimK-type ligase-like ATP-grasp enzyme
MVPFKLPARIINKLKKLSKLKNLNSGSIDLIFTTERKFIFLEINPVGQYDYLEYYTNYPISKTIAKLLMHAR